MTKGSGDTYNGTIDGIDEDGDVEFYIEAIDNVDLVSISSTSDFTVSTPLGIDLLLVAAIVIVLIVVVGGIIFIRKRRK